MTRSVFRLVVLALLVVGMGPGWGRIEQARAATPDQDINLGLQTFARLAKRLEPTVVNIHITKTVSTNFGPNGLFSQFFHTPPMSEVMKGLGSGVIISSNGYIVTNNHVIDGANHITVTLSDGRNFKGHVVGTDPKTDLALLHIDAHGLPVAPLGNSDKLQVGDWVMAIGNPFGLDETVTVGVLSGKGRVIGEGPYDDFLQTDASINPGNSGGPLFNTNGKVVGINTAIIKGGQGIGFAIPINMARYVIDQLKSTGHIVRGFVGLGIQALTPELRRALDLPRHLKGALVSSVVPDGPAAHAGARVQDVVVRFNGRPIASDRDLLDMVARTPVGSRASLTVYRNGHDRKLWLTVAVRPGEQQTASTGSGASGTFGLHVRNLTPSIASQLNIPDARGVVITSVDPGSAADQAGLQAGDVVRKVGSRVIHNSQEFREAVRHHHRGIALLVERGGRTMFVVIKG